MGNEPLQGMLYDHYKGGRYMVLTIATHVDTKDRMVVYASVDDGRVWTRLVTDWNSPTADGKKRFQEHLIQTPPG